MKFFAALAWALIPIRTVYAQQEWMGMNGSNYAGVVGLHLQPASIADNRLCVDVTLGAFDFSLYNNLVKFKRASLTADGEDWRDYVEFDYSSGGKKMFFNAGVQLPSFMFSTPKWGAGFTTRFRTFVTLTGLGGELAELLVSEFKEERLYNVLLSNPKLTFNALPYFEFGLPVGATVWKSGAHFVKAGAKVKYMVGMPTASVRIQSSDYTFLSKDEVTLPRGTEVYFAGSLGFDFNNVAGELTLQPGPSFGFDFGAVYEWRPKPDSVYRYDMDGKTGLVRKDLNKYRFRGGISLIDWGWVRYKTAFNRGYGVVPNAERAGVPADWHYWNIANLSIDGIEELDSVLLSRFERLHASEGLTVPLPAVVSLQADWNVMDVKGLYLGLTTVHPFRMSRWAPRGFHTFTLAPRFEHKWVGAALPLTLNEMGQADVGLSMMLGPVLLGTHSLNGLFAAKTNRVHVFAAVRIPIPYATPRDRDGDKVSNRKDKCRNEPGLWENRGCPEALSVVRDRDGDGVLDDEDRCPDLPGIASAQGCPDKDKDGVADIDDECPDDYGPAAMRGCPDTDGDGIIDKNDACPRTPGLAPFLGCPDTDGDTVPDNQDECPNKAGDPLHDGCPDTDGDGVYDHRDRCPEEPGSRQNLGCPDDIPVATDDADGDGVIDRLDDCPLTPGVAENKGCPPLPKEDAEILKTAFENLEFETGRAVIKNESLDELKKLAELLLRKPEYRLRVSGHTDNVGDKAFNQRLSLERANAVKTRLMEYGVPESRIFTEGYGDSLPVAPNTTPEGRAKNRRVELKLLRF